MVSANHPANNTVSAEAPLPINDRATGTIRTTVRLSTAYHTVSTSIRGAPLVTITAPNTRNVAALST